MSSFTPGPWRAEPPQNDTVLWAVTSSSGDLAYLTLHRDRLEANARLIAAAPELLDACKGLLADFSFETCDRARAAIAKATGAPAHIQAEPEGERHVVPLRLSSLGQRKD